ncbi:hypothetical protein GGR53DRAFT_467897 [Hypoxylon sp. FL1150]|nr:hypothetical protein GGR53DRAFT_467897 [Hypoxylon sp. FL1150]
MFHREVFDSHNGLNRFNSTMQGRVNPDVVPLGDDGTGIPDVQSPPGTSIGAFASRPRQQQLDEHVHPLCQDVAHEIRAVAIGRRQRVAWVGEADAGATDIACLAEVVCDEPEQTTLSRSSSICSAATTMQTARSQRTG